MRLSLGGALVKGVIVGLIVWVLGLFGVSKVSYLVLAIFAWMLSVARTHAVAELEGLGRFRIALGTEGMMQWRHEMMRRSLLGNLAFACLLGGFWPFAEAVASPSRDDWRTVIALMLGLVSSVLM
ncbi:hypothetical protein ASG57_33835 [Bradyrhizobium sp. Leaf396]|jgi:hypothetical protein|nr:hypothetical protein ASG57_33835 [Bradyrhizobium sp. Leaf396]